MKTNMFKAAMLTLSFVALGSGSTVQAGNADYTIPSLGAGMVSGYGCSYAFRKMVKSGMNPNLAAGCTLGVMVVASALRHQFTRHIPHNPYSAYGLATAMGTFFYTIDKAV